MASSIKQLLSHALHFFYPPLCLHCETKIPNHHPLFCAGCLEHLTLIDARHSCPYCFKTLEAQTTCVTCRKFPALYKRLAAACELQGPAKTLLTHYQQGAPYLSSAMAALMAMQLIKLDWPLPDLIIPLSETPLQHLLSGIDRNLLLAREVGKILERPCTTALKSSVDFSFLSDETQEKSHRFSLNKGHSFADQKVLLVAETFERTLIRRAAEALRDGFPLEIRVLCFAVKE